MQTYKTICGQISYFLCRVPVLSDKQLISRGIKTHASLTCSEHSRVGRCADIHRVGARINTARRVSEFVPLTTHENNLTHKIGCESFIFCALPVIARREDSSQILGGCVIACPATIYPGASRPCVRTDAAPAP